MAGGGETGFGGNAHSANYQVAVTGAAAKIARKASGLGAARLLIRVSADSYLGTDNTVTSSTGYLIKATDTMPHEILARDDQYIVTATTATAYVHEGWN